jgi:hypothetical protein
MGLDIDTRKLWLETAYMKEPDPQPHPHDHPESYPISYEQEYLLGKRLHREPYISGFPIQEQNVSNHLM